MDQHNKPNGEAQAEALRLPHIIIAVEDPAMFRLSVKGSYPNLDYAMNMLDQVRRELESQWRLARLQQMQAQAMEQARAQAIADQVMRKR